jgi:hypothetical protein
MPFTPAHAAIILPLVKNARYFSGTALVIGSFAPDFEYFFKMSVDGVHGHKISGIFYFDLPVVILLSFVFHLVVKENLIRSFPLFLQSKFQPLLQLDFITYFKKNWIAFSISAIIGAASHIFWDGFTHGDGYFVKHLSFYEGKYIPFQGVHYPLWYALQHISTFVGLIILSIYILATPKVVIADRPTPSLLYWVLLLAMILIITAIRFAIKSSDYNIGNLIVTIISALCIGVIVLGLDKRKAIS